MLTDASVREQALPLAPEAVRAGDLVFFEGPDAVGVVTHDGHILLDTATPQYLTHANAARWLPRLTRFGRLP